MKAEVKSSAEHRQGGRANERVGSGRMSIARRTSEDAMLQALLTTKDDKESLQIGELSGAPITAARRMPPPVGASASGSAAASEKRVGDNSARTARVGALESGQIRVEQQLNAMERRNRDLLESTDELKRLVRAIGLRRSEGA
jgi:hypothetical protein